MDGAQAESGGDAHFIGINSAVFAAFDRKKAEERGQQKKESRLELLIKNWRRPTFPQTSAVSSARAGLTSRCRQSRRLRHGMGRGEHSLHSHQNKRFDIRDKTYKRNQF